MYLYSSVFRSYGLPGGEVSMPFVAMSQTDDLAAIATKYYQSSRGMHLDQPLDVDFTLWESPGVGGGRSGGYESRRTHALLDFFRQKKEVYDMSSKLRKRCPTLCLPCALINGLTFIMVGSEATNANQKRQGQMEAEARALCREADVSQSEPCSFEDLLRISETASLCNFRIRVFDFKGEVQFDTQDAGVRVGSTINLLLVESHYMFVSQPGTLRGMPFYCELCSKPHALKLHRCPKAPCQNCLQPDCANIGSTVEFYDQCERCGATTKTDACRMVHKCNQRRKCDICDLWDTLSNFKHGVHDMNVCGTQYCRTCEKRMPPHHAFHELGPFKPKLGDLTESARIEEMEKRGVDVDDIADDEPSELAVFDIETLFNTRRKYNVRTCSYIMISGCNWKMER